MPLKINKNAGELALIIGHIYGDGGIQNNGRVHYCNSEDFLIKEFVESMNNIFNVKPWINKEPHITRVRYPVKVGKTLWKIFGKFSSGKDTKIITPEINEMSLKWKVTMLQAWFNDDGSVVNIPPNYKVIAIKQKLKHLIIFIKNTLQEFGIKSKIMEDDRKWLLRIHGYENMIKFKDCVNFSQGYRKREKLNEMIQSITRPCFVTKKKILDLLKESPMTRKEMAQLLGKSEEIIYGHLHGWKRKIRKSNKGLIDLDLVKMRKEGRINIYLLSSASPSPMWGYEEGQDTGAQC